MSNRMYKTASFEDELYESMEKQLVANQVEDTHGMKKLAKAVDYLNASHLSLTKLVWLRKQKPSLMF